jgi:hypothetical protein
MSYKDRQVEPFVYEPAKDVPGLMAVPVPKTKNGFMSLWEIAEDMRKAGMTQEQINDVVYKTDNQEADTTEVK